MIQRLIYCSRVARSVRYADAQQIARASATRNAKVGVSGLLVYTPSHFIQVLEGPSDHVQATFERIHNDPRHEQLQVLEEARPHAPEFKEWPMHVVMGPLGLRGPDLDALGARAALKLLQGLRLQLLASSHKIGIRHTNTGRLRQTE